MKFAAHHVFIFKINFIILSLPYIFNVHSFLTCQISINLVFSYKKWAGNLPETTWLLFNIQLQYSKYIEMPVQMFFKYISVKSYAYKWKIQKCGKL